MKTQFKLKQATLGLPAGTVFNHREWDRNNPDCGNPAHGALVLAWNDYGGCQSCNWTGGAFWLPGQLAANAEWFEPVNMTKQKLLDEIDRLADLVHLLPE